MAQSEPAEVSAFMTLVDEWVAAHPVRTKVLSKPMIRFAAAKLLLWKTDKSSRRQTWPGGSALQLVSILLYLLAFEGLIHSNNASDAAASSSAHATGSEQMVLGFSLIDILDAAKEAIRRTGLTRDEVVATVLGMDLDGDMTELANSKEFANALFGAEAGGARPISAADDPMMDAAAPFSSAEPAALSLHGLVSTPPVLERAVRMQLARRFLNARRLLLGFAGVWFVFQDIVWRGVDSTGVPSNIPANQVIFFSTCMGLGLTIIAASYPHELNSPSGREFILPITMLCAFCSCTASWLSYTGQDARRTQVNDGCRRVHALLCLSVIANWWTGCVLCVRGKLSWTALRGILVVDGFEFFACNMLLLFLGPPPVFQPRSMTFTAAMGRAAVCPALAALLTHRNRCRAAALFERFGWNHVILSLRTLRRVHFESAKGHGDSHDSKASSRSSHSSHSWSRGSRSGLRVRRMNRKPTSNYELLQQETTTELYIPPPSAGLHGGLSNQN